MQVKTKRTLFMPIAALIVAAASFISVLILPADSASALTAKQCRDKYNGKEVTSALSTKMNKDKCAFKQGGPCGGAYSGGKGYISCPNTSSADTFCKKKYPNDAGKRNACRSGYFSMIAGCAGYTGAQKKACEAGKTESEKDDNSGSEDSGSDSDGSGISNPIEGDGCGGVKTAIIKCSQDNTGDVENNGIWGLLLIIVNILTAGVGIVAVGGIVYGSVLYTTAEDKADQVKKATDIITNVVIGLVAFALMWAGLNFIVPGGVFN